MLEIKKISPNELNEYVGIAYEGDEELLVFAVVERLQELLQIGDVSDHSENVGGVHNLFS